MFLRSLLQAAAFVPFLFSTTTAQNACNNSPQLCSRAYNNITYLGAHNSPFLRNDKTSFSTSGNHYYNTTIQLDAGVRMLTAQVHKNTGSGADAWHLCHSSCNLLDAGTLSSWLSEIKAWMDKNPNDVVTVILVNTDNASPSDLGQQFESSGIDKLAYTPPSATIIPQTWPTLDRLIGNNTRLMAFVTPLGQVSSQYPYLMDQYAFTFENNFENISPTNYSCNPSRPTSLRTPSAALESGRLFVMNHFLYESSSFIQSPNETYANITNAQSGTGSLGQSIKECTGVYGKPPSFVMVDFFNVGPAIASVDEANGVSSATGRRTVSTAALKQGSGGGSTGGVGKHQGSMFAVVVAVVVAITFGA